jgi:DNA repair protein RecO (recombination protein O)
MSLNKCRAIVIRTVNYSENSVILKCYTDQFGIQSYLVNGIRSKKGAIKPSHLLPLTLLELEIYHQKNKSLQRIKELKCLPNLRALHFDIIKSAIGMYMAELIYKSVKEEDQPDIPLFEFLFNAIQIVDLDEGKTANFPIYFTLQLTRYLGFYPKGIYSEQTNSFDLKEGVFDQYNNKNPFQLEPFFSERISLLLQSDLNAFKDILLTYDQRTLLLTSIIAYYQQHISGFHEMKSHKILSEILL